MTSDPSIQSIFNPDLMRQLRDPQDPFQGPHCDTAAERVLPKDEGTTCTAEISDGPKGLERRKVL